MIKNRLRHLKDETGIALVYAIIFLAIMVTVSVSVSYFALEGTHHSSYQRAAQQAYALSEAGINNAGSVLNNTVDPTQPGLLPTRTLSYSGGTVTYSGTYDAATQI